MFARTVTRRLRALPDGGRPLPLIGKPRAVPDGTAELADAELMVRVAGGHYPAYQVLVSRHVDRVFGLAQRIIGERAEAEDIVQEAFLRVWLQASRWQPEKARFTTWLFRIVANLCIDHLRKHRGETLELTEEIEDTAPRADVVACVERQQIGARVAAEVLRLPLRQRTALALCYYEGCSNQEAAEILGVGPGAVESLLVRARRTLQKRLASLIER
jgi:RNA polymerase sigma-70 factor (ECF subfamily)